jgi:aryl-alcohol dehydrogenase-like predicted oxidoreductase
MKATTLGCSGLEVSRIAFGTWQLGGDWGPFDEAKAVAAIRRARELGVNLSERILGRALRQALIGNRDELVIATKGGLRQTDSGIARDASPKWLRNGVDASLSALGIDNIDLYQLHWPDASLRYMTLSQGAGRDACGTHF